MPRLLTAREVDEIVKFNRSITDVTEGKLRAEIKRLEDLILTAQDLGLDDGEISNIIHDEGDAIRERRKRG